MITIDDVRRAAEALSDRVERTPTVRSDALSREIGAEVHLKLESLQRTGSFKVRGALNAVLSLEPEARSRGVVTISAGNHGQGLAYAAARFGVPAVVVMPPNPNPSKLAATRALGAEVVIAESVHAAFETMERLRVERGLTLVHPFDDPPVMAGQGTVALEALEDLPDADLFVVPVGGGGLLAGTLTVAKALRPSARVVAVEPEGADGMRRALEARAIVRLERVSTIADGLAAPFAGKNTLEAALRLLDEIVVLSDAEILAGFRFLLESARVLAEPAGAAPIGALLARKARPAPGSKVVAIVSGGNVDPARIPEYMEAAR